MLDIRPTRTAAKTQNHAIRLVGFLAFLESESLTAIRTFDVILVLLVAEVVLLVAEVVVVLLLRVVLSSVLTSTLLSVLPLPLPLVGARFARNLLLDHLDSSSEHLLSFHCKREKLHQHLVKVIAI